LLFYFIFQKRYKSDLKRQIKRRKEIRKDLELSWKNACEEQKERKLKEKFEKTTKDEMSIIDMMNKYKKV
jgi:hypothetical protein